MIDPAKWRLYVRLFANFGKYWLVPTKDFRCMVSLGDIRVQPHSFLHPPECGCSFVLSLTPLDMENLNILSDGELG